MLSKIIAAALPCAAFAGELTYGVFTGRSTSFIVEKGLVNVSGRNDYGQLGLGNTEVQLNFTRISGIPLVKQIATGAFHTLILDEGGDVYVTGRNHKGQLGNGGTTDTSGQLTKLDIGKVDQVAAGYAHSVFLMEDGSVKAAGWNFYGQLGDGSTNDAIAVVEIPPFNRSAAKVNAQESTDASTEESTNATSTEATTPAPTPSPFPQAMAVAAGYDFTYILSKSGEVYAVGNNLGGQLGLNGGRSGTAVAEVVLQSVTSISAGESHGLFMMTDDRVMATGANFAGQLGDGTTFNKAQPVSVHNLKDAKAVAAAGDGSCIAEWGLKCCGSNLVGQLGLGGGIFITEPESIPEVDLADSMAPGETHSLFLNHDDVMITGVNSFGQLGRSDTNLKLSTPQLSVTLDRAERTTTVPPTPHPTPAPSPTPTPPVLPPTPAPSPDRDSNNDSRDWPWEMLVAGIASGLAVVIVVVCLFDRPTEGDQPARQSVAAPETITQSMELRQHEPVVV